VSLAVFRVDASVEVGTGHLARCRTLAEELRGRGWQVLLACRELPPGLADLVRRDGFDLRRIDSAAAEWEGDAAETIGHLAGRDAVDWLVVDHYALDARWEERLRPLARRVMVIDDLADREHACDLLLDQNLVEGMEARYGGKVPEGCRMLLGPRYALLRRAFVEAAHRGRRRDGSLRRLVVSYGGSDPTDETTKALRALAGLRMRNVALDVVVGAANPRREEIGRLALDAAGARCHADLDAAAMADLIASADLALGAAGTSTWERCLLGLPALLTVVAPNQAPLARAVADRGAGVDLGPAGEVDDRLLAETVRELAGQPDRVRSMSRAAHAVMDGFVGAPGVAAAMEEVGSRAA
jgi:UDP-2,4-diacetamido-2,4,6-trideoxy-beta-L-altropyranose hydrolase